MSRGGPPLPPPLPPPTVAAPRGPSISLPLELALFLFLAHVLCSICGVSEAFACRICKQVMLLCFFLPDIIYPHDVCVKYPLPVYGRWDLQCCIQPAGCCRCHWRHSRISVISRISCCMFSSSSGCRCGFRKQEGEERSDICSVSARASCICVHHLHRACSGARPSPQNANRFQSLPSSALLLLLLVCAMFLVFLLHDSGGGAIIPPRLTNNAAYAM